MRFSLQNRFYLSTELQNLTSQYIRNNEALRPHAQLTLPQSILCANLLYTICHLRAIIGPTTNDYR
jgi:hypothetical protein